MSKKVAVLFSGGLDSTYLVWKNLKDGNEVQLIYIEIQNNKVKSTIEKNRIGLLVKEFRKEFNKDEEEGWSEERHIHDVRYILKIDVDAREDSLLFKQVPIWIIAALFSQDLNVDEIQITYVANDDAIGYLSDIKKAYKSYKPLMRYLKPLVFPLSKVPKYEMAHHLPKQYRNFIFSCEMPTIIGPEDAEFIEYKPCCGCTPCKHIISDNYYGLGEFPEYYKENILKQHVHEINSFGYKVVDKEGKEFNNWGSLDKEKDKAEPKDEPMPYQLKLDLKPPVDMSVFKSPGVFTVERDENMMKGKIVDDKGVLSVIPMTETQFNV